MKKMMTGILAATMIMALTACGSSGSASSSGSAAAAETKAAEGSAEAASTDVDWPTKTVTVVVPYKAGGDTDSYCRALFTRAGEKLGETFVVTNVEGGSGMIAAMDVMGKAPDG